MSIPHGADSSGHYHPLLVDTTGRPLIVIDTVSGLVFTVTPDVGAEWTVKSKAGETWTPAQTTPANLTVGDHGYDGSAWRKQGMIWAYKDRLGERKSNLTPAAGYITLDGTAVPAGEIWIVRAVAISNQTSVCGPCIIYALNSAGGVALAWGSTLAIKQPLWASVDMVLKEGDYIEAQWNAVVAGDDLYLDIWGYKMGIAM